MRRIFTKKTPAVVEASGRVTLAAQHVRLAREALLGNVLVNARLTQAQELLAQVEILLQDLNTSWDIIQSPNLDISPPQFSSTPVAPAGPGVPPTQQWQRSNHNLQLTDHQAISPSWDNASWSFETNQEHPQSPLPNQFNQTYQYSQANSPSDVVIPLIELSDGSYRANNYLPNQPNQDGDPFRSSLFSGSSLPPSFESQQLSQEFVVEYSRLPDEREPPYQLQQQSSGAFVVDRSRLPENPQLSNHSTSCSQSNQQESSEIFYPSDPIIPSFLSIDSPINLEGMNSSDFVDRFLDNYSGQSQQQDNSNCCGADSSRLSDNRQLSNQTNQQGNSSAFYVSDPINPTCLSLDSPTNLEGIDSSDFVDKFLQNYSPNNFYIPSYSSESSASHKSHLCNQGNQQPFPPPAVPGPSRLCQISVRPVTNNACSQAQGTTSNRPGPMNPNVSGNNSNDQAQGTGLESRDADLNVSGRLPSHPDVTLRCPYCNNELATSVVVNVELNNTDLHNEAEAEFNLNVFLGALQLSPDDMLCPYCGRAIHLSLHMNLPDNFPPLNLNVQHNSGQRPPTPQPQPPGGEGDSNPNQDGCGGKDGE